MDRSYIEGTKAVGTDPATARRIEGTNDEERRRLAGAYEDELVSVDKGQVPQFEEREGEVLYSRAGVRGADLIFHFYTDPFPAEGQFRRVLAESFMEVVGTIQGVEASWDDTMDFEEFPSMWAVRAVGMASNPLAKDKALTEIPVVLERRLLELNGQ